MATIKDVSQLANVSISTVSRVINNTAQVAPEKREAVLAAMKELNFRPNSFAQALVSKRSNCIGVLVGDLCGGPFFAQMMRGIETMVDQANKFTIVMSGNHDIARERHAIQALLQRQCDALILHSKALPDEELSELAAGSTPSCLSTVRCRALKIAASGSITRRGSPPRASTCWMPVIATSPLSPPMMKSLSMVSSGWPVTPRPWPEPGSPLILHSSAAPLPTKMAAMWR